MFKSQFGLEYYLRVLPKDLRILLSKFRCGSHRLPISNARYLEIVDKNDCNLCFEDVGDEFHYLFKCPAFADLRTKLIQPYYYIKPNSEKYQRLMETSDKKLLINLCKFIKSILHVFRP